MKILFITPTPRNGKRDVYPHKQNLLARFLILEKPITFAVLAALTPKKHTIEVIDGDYNDIDFNEKYDLVGITTYIRSTSIAYKIADEFRRKGTKVIIGGWHASSLPQEAKQHADSVVIGEAEETWPILLKDFENGNLKPFYKTNQPVQASNIPHPRSEIYPIGTRVAVQATRGCPNGCEFCCITNAEFRNIFRTRDINEVINEIKSLNYKIFHFHDNSMTINKNYTKQLFKAMNGLGKKFIAYGNIGQLYRDEELLKLASEAGCLVWRVGFESIVQDNLKAVGKKTNKVEEYIKAINEIHDYGILIEGSFIFGFDYDTLDVFDNTYEFVRKSGMDIPYYHILLPCPGTPLYDKFEREGRILTKDWSKYGSQQHVVFQPKNMTPEQLYDNTIRVRKMTHSPVRSIERMLRSSRLGFYPFVQSSIRNFFLMSGPHMQIPENS